MRMLTAVLLGIMYLTSCAPCVDHDEPRTNVQQLDQSTGIPNDRIQKGVRMIFAYLSWAVRVGEG